ncbi:MAG: hypothetical protein PHV95_01425 [Eubacteriales bacterium]|nr:hypothetical protein [Eubacteriales bacterium]
MLKKTITFILVLTAIISVLVSCKTSSTGSYTSNNNGNTVSDKSKEKSNEVSDDDSDSTSSQTSGNTVSDNLKETSNEVSDEVSEDLSEPETSQDDVSLQVKKYFDIIFAKDTSKSEKELMAEFPDEFAAIVSFGEKAFPALDEIANDRESYGIKSAFAHYIKQAIKPELYARVFKSPDGKFAIKAVVDTFINMSSIGEVYYFELIDCKTNTTLIVLKDNYYKFTVQWSPDNRYASIEYGSSFFYITDVIDFQELKTIKLPDAKEVESIVQNKFNNDYNVYSDFFGFTHNQWVDDNKIKINIELRSPPEYEGWYIYDLVKKEIVEIDIQKSEVSR